MLMNETELITWLREWVAQTTGADIADIDPAKPLQTFGLSSRDAVIMSGELENLLGTRIDPTIAYQYPTIASLAAALTAQKTCLLYTSPSPRD